MKVLAITAAGLLLCCSSLWASRYVMPEELVVKTSPYILVAKLDAIGPIEVTATPVRILKGEIVASTIKIRFPNDRPLRLSKFEKVGGSYLVYLDLTDAGYFTFHPYRLSRFQQISGNSITSGHNRTLIPLGSELRRITRLIETPLHILLSPKTEKEASTQRESVGKAD